MALARYDLGAVEQLTRIDGCYHRRITPDGVRCIVRQLSDALAKEAKANRAT